MRHDYTELDAAILEAIKCGRAEFNQISCAVAEVSAKHVAAERFAGVSHARGKPGWRFVDARLQALRSVGRIKFEPRGATSRGGWMLVEREG